VRRPWLFALGLVLLVAAWAFSDPPSAAPDETVHYIKALAAGRGDLFGRPGSYPAGSESPTQLAYANVNTRAFDVPADMAPPDPCYAHLSARSAACLPHAFHSAPGPMLSYVGVYQPVAYLLPGLAMRLAADPWSAYVLGRLASAAQGMALLALALVLLGAARWRLAGILLATTPMVLFLASSLNPSGPELCSAIAFTAMVLAQAVQGGRDRRLWAGIAASGALLALSRPLSAAWVVLPPAMVIALHGPGTARRVIAAGGGPALAAVGVVAAAVLAAAAWTLAFQHPIGTGATSLPDTLRASLGEPLRLLREEVGSFGQLDAPLPDPAIGAWLALVADLAALAFAVSTWRERIVLAGTGAAVVAITIAESALLILPTGFALQGRYVLPAAVAVPVLAGELVHRHRDRVPVLVARAGWAVVLLGVATIQLLAWLVNAHRNAIGAAGRLNFLVYGDWRPPLGWWPWLALAALGAGLLVAGGAREAWPERPAAPGRRHRTAVRSR